MCLPGRTFELAAEREEDVVWFRAVKRRAAAASAMDGAAKDSAAPAVLPVLNVPASPGDPPCTLTELADAAGGRILRGLAKKRGANGGAWQARFLELRESQLTYYKCKADADEGKAPQGIVDMNTITAVRRSATLTALPASGAPPPALVFNLQTPTRVFEFAAENHTDLRVWLHALSPPPAAAARDLGAAVKAVTGATFTELGF